MGKITNLPLGENFKLVSMLGGSGNIYAFLTDRFKSDWNKYLWEYNVESNKWNNIYNLDYKEIRHGSGLFWYENKVNMIGGENVDSNPRKEWFQFDPYDGSVNEIDYDPNGYFSRVGSGFWFVNGVIYFALGDVARDRDQYKFPKYNIINKLLSFEKDIPVTSSFINRYGFFDLLPTFNINNNFYILLESNNSDDNNEIITLLKYNIDDDTWANNVIDIPKPSRREMLSFELFGNLYIGGGIINQEHIFDFYKVNLNDFSYVRVKDIPNSVRYTSNTKVGDQIFIYGSSYNCNDCEDYAIYEFILD
ncbi:hypothetical protein [Cyclobacterium qasimii]|uniref:Kelch repeat protein n=1 Tax=Cyclobacterium qasimii M12-11B TaxID=641524 RepID=S7V6Y4_9BACT|nr:hypothetical protein [Cyclobacterium qasimii]EPR66000.1 hypothetical protein ADICYQ_4989 [Cyclobacterium qasimii M12-11B]